MTRLIHLNGLPGVGKSTLARRYVEEHRFALNLEVDLLRRSLGQWQEDPASGLKARRLAIAATREMSRDLGVFLRRRNGLIAVDTDGMASEQSYRLLMSALRGAAAPG